MEGIQAGADGERRGRGVNVDIDIVPGANHFFTDHLEAMISHVSLYLDAAPVEGTVADPNFDPLA